MKIYIDGDACPVKKEIVEISSKYNLAVVIILSICHISNRDGYSEYIIMDHQNQSVDMEIINRVKAGDVVITDDYGLASIVLMKGVRCMSSRGMEYTNDNIEILLYRRHINQKILKSGGKVTGPSKRTGKENEQFSKNYEYMLRQSLYNNFP
ncbi:MAG: DUF188 domain-containing protein [Thermotaleaceae bacterium]